MYIDILHHYACLDVATNVPIPLFALPNPPRGGSASPVIIYLSEQARPGNACWMALPDRRHLGGYRTKR